MTTILTTSDEEVLAQHEAVVQQLLARLEGFPEEISTPDLLTGLASVLGIFIGEGTPSMAEGRRKMKLAIEIIRAEVGVRMDLRARKGEIE